MLFSVFLALFLPCVGMSVVFVLYMCLLCHSSGTGADVRDYDSSSAATKIAPPKGLMAEELLKLPKVTGKELIMGNECAVCLDVIEEEHSARLIPGCNHGFHLECADAWLSKHPVCPVCRAKLGPEMFDSEASPC